MARKPNKTVEEQIYEAKLKIIEAKEKYSAQRYFETMPTYDPLYTYCYTTSNRAIPGYEQNIDDWLRAVIKHMGLRHRGHGGELTKAVLISIPEGLKEKDIDTWIDYETRKLRKLATSRVKKK
jgi:hypothetical protein